MSDPGFFSVKQFECHGCGNCCRSVYRSKKLHNGFFVSDAEAEWLREEAKKQKIQISFKPYESIADKNSKKLIVKSWRLNHDSCPFFSAGKCTVYDRRPLICRSFPVVNTGLHGGQAFVRSLICPSEKEFTPPEKTIVKESIEIMKQRYGDNFYSAFLMEELHFDEKSVVDSLMESGKIKPRPDIGGYKPIGLYEYLEDIHEDGSNRMKIIQDEILKLEITKNKVANLEKSISR